MKRERGPSRGKKIILVIVLAVVCIGGAELLVCRIMAPDLYGKITTPIVETVSSWGRAIGETVGGWMQSTQAAVGEAFAKERELSKAEELEEAALSENQSVTDPAIWTDLSYLDPALTSLIEREGREVLTGGTVEVIYYNQTDTEWSFLPYGSDTIGRYGCGPVVMAMAVSSMTAYDIDPGAMATWAREQGYWARRSGSYLSIVEGTATSFGLNAEPFHDFDADQLIQELAAGKLVVALVTKGHFTNGGHFILLRGVTLEGEVLVADPASRDLSLLTWDPELILDELSSSRNDGAPLWLLSPVQPIEYVGNE